MKLFFSPTTKLALCCTAVFAAMMAFSGNVNAFTLDFQDSRNLGWADPSDATGNTNEAVYVNTLISFAQGSGLHSGVDGHDYFRRNTSCGSCVAAVFSSADNSGSNIVNLGTGGFTYLLGTYMTRSVIWNVQGLTGVITIPDYLNRCALGHWTLFGPGGAVPDGGTTVMLLGIAFGALGFARRFLKI